MGVFLRAKTGVRLVIEDDDEVYFDHCKNAKNKKSNMKILSVIVLSGAALALAGCGNQGGSSDEYNTGSGASSNTYDRYGITNNYQGGALSPAGINTGDGYNTNFPGFGTNHHGNATNAQPIDPERTNNVPEN